MDVASVVTPLHVFTMPESYEPTYGLLLSRRWLRVCQAVGDYAVDAYVIKDEYRSEHKVLQERAQSPNSQRPKICIRPGITQSRLDMDLIAELELDEHKSFDEIVRQIIGGGQTELAVYKALEGCEEDYEPTDSDGLRMEDEKEESGTGYETDRCREESEMEDQSENASEQESEGSASHGRRAHVINSKN